jgi:hypothetical protein
MIKNLLIIAAIVATLLIFVGWRLQTPPPPALQTSILLDVSSSFPSPCMTLEGMVRLAQERSSGHPGSTITVLTSGDAKTAFEPAPLLTQSLSDHQRLMRGKQAVQRDKEAFVAEFVKLCSALPTTKATPLFLDIKHAVEHARPVPGGSVHAQVFVITDLEETKEPQIVRALRQRPGTKSPLPQPINNTNVEITICGYAQTIGETKGEDGIRRNFTAPRTAQHADRLLEVWQQLFTDHVTFDSFCPAVTNALGPS